MGLLGPDRGREHARGRRVPCEFPVVVEPPRREVDSAGGQRGTTFETKLGGEDVYGTTAAIVSGKGVTVVVTDSKDPAAANDKDKNKKEKKRKAIQV